jgi:hypothetical protein
VDITCILAQIYSKNNYSVAFTEFFSRRVKLAFQMGNITNVIWGEKVVREERKRVGNRKKKGKRNKHIGKVN